MIQKVNWKPFFYSGSWVFKPRQLPKWFGRGEQALQRPGENFIFSKVENFTSPRIFLCFFIFWSGSNFRVWNWPKGVFRCINMTWVDNWTLTPLIWAQNGFLGNFCIQPNWVRLQQTNFQWANGWAKPGSLQSWITFEPVGGFSKTQLFLSLLNL